MSDEIGYQGPSEVYVPSIGNNPERDFSKNLTTEANQGYDNIDWLRNQLDTLLAISKEIAAVLDGQLDKLALRVTDTTADLRLRQAFSSEWPDPATSPPKYIPYRYYKGLVSRNTAASIYIRERWQTAAREVSGTSAFDMVDVVEIMRDEALLVKEFLDKYVGTVSDSSEKRSVELFQDWAASAIQRAARIRTIAATKEDARTIPSSEVDSATPEQAKQLQAVFKVKLNQLNQQLDQAKAAIKKNFADYSDTFYNHFLGPALQFRLNVSAQTYPDASTATKIQSSNIQGATDSNLSYQLTDQLRRNGIFTQKVDQFANLLLQRDTYRTYVAQLAVVGSVLDIDPRGKLTVITDSDLEQFPEFQNDLPQATPIFDAPHSLLSGTDDALAHPQYLLRDGGTITGDIGVATETKIDGVDLDRHEHDGLDGSHKIKGTSIEGGTLSSSAVDLDDKPPIPTDLRLVSITSKVVPPGATTLEALVTWEGQDKYTYEAQISRG